MHGAHKKSVMTDKRSDIQMELCGLIFTDWFVIKLYKCFFVRVKWHTSSVNFVLD